MFPAFPLPENQDVAVPAVREPLLPSPTIPDVPALFPPFITIYFIDS